MLELVVVLVIATGLIGLAAPRVASLFPGVELKGAARDIASALRYARGRAIASGGETAVVLDVEERTYWLEGAGRSEREGLGERIGIELLTGASELRDENTGALRFFPDGSSTGGQVALTSGERRFVVDVVWLTGKVSIYEG